MEEPKSEFDLHALTQYQTTCVLKKLVHIDNIVNFWCLSGNQTLSLEIVGSWKNDVQA